MKLKLFILFVLISFFATNAIAQNNGIILSEVMFDVPPDSLGDANGDGIRGSHSDEFVEFYNNGTDAVDMSGYQVIEREGVPVFSFPVGASLNPGQYAVVFGAVGSAGFGSSIPAGTLLFAVNENDDNNDGFDNGLGKSNFSNSRDRVMLVDVLTADTLLEVYWGGTSTNPMSALSSKGIKLIAPNTLVSDSIAGPIKQSVTLDPESSNKWDLHTIVTGDTTLLFSPGARAIENITTPETPIIISEVMFDVPKDSLGDANGDGVRGSHSDEFIEIYNEGIGTVDLTGYHFLDKEGLSVYTFPDGTTLAPGKFAVVFGAVGSAGFGNNLPPTALYLAVNENDDNNDGFDNGAGKSNFSNKGDAVLLVNPATSDTVSEVYWGNALPQTSKAIYLGPPNTVTGDSISGSIKQSVTRKTDNPLWDLHTVVSNDETSLFSPGSDATKSSQTIEGDFILTEVMFDVPKDSLGDANGDGVRGSHSDEFIEFYNRGSSEINLEGYQILDRNALPIFTFPAGASVQPNQFAVVFGGVGSAGYGSNIPSGTALFQVAVADSNVGFDDGSGHSNLSKSNDVVLLVNPAASDTVLEVYWGSATPLSSKAIYLGFPNSISGNDLSGSIGQSVTHLLNSDKWDIHTIVTGNSDYLFSPGLDPLVTSVNNKKVLPLNFSLSQNYPNPFNPSTIIRFSIPQSAVVSLKIFNVLGQEVKTLRNEFTPKGTYNITFDASSGGRLASGIYIYQIRAGNYINSKKMILLK